MKNEFLKTLAYCAFGVALLKGTCVLYDKNKNALKQEDFDKAEWIEFYNSNGRIWSCYMKEKIPRNQFNWHFYIDEVRRRNNNNLAGKILLPDLDGNGKVGK
jgi:hypothetical protein